MYMNLAYSSTKLFTPSLLLSHIASTMRSALLALVALASVLARAQNTSYINGLVSALEGAGLTQLVSVAATVNGTSVGQSLLADLTSGNAYTIFAPSNDACKSNPSLLSFQL